MCLCVDRIAVAVDAVIAGKKVKALVVVMMMAQLELWFTYFVFERRKK